MSPAPVKDTTRTWGAEPARRSQEEKAIIFPYSSATDSTHRGCPHPRHLRSIPPCFEGVLDFWDPPPWGPFPSLGPGRHPLLWEVGTWQARWSWIPFCPEARAFLQHQLNSSPLQGVLPDEVHGCRHRLGRSDPLLRGLFVPWTPSTQHRWPPPLLCQEDGSRLPHAAPLFPTLTLYQCLRMNEQTASRDPSSPEQEGEIQEVSGLRP